MNRKTKEIYSEVYQVLNFLGNEYIDKLPKSLVNMLEKKGILIMSLNIQRIYH